MQREELSDQTQNACATIRNIDIYDWCEKDIKNCRPHSLKPEDGLLTIDKDFLSLTVLILDQRGQNHKDNENAGSLYMKQFTSWSGYAYCSCYFSPFISHFTDQATFCWYSMYRFCFLLFILHVYVHCYCLRFCAFICYNIIKLISSLDIIAYNFHFYVAFCSPWWKIEVSQRNKLPWYNVMADWASRANYKNPLFIINHTFQFAKHKGMY